MKDQCYKTILANFRLKPSWQLRQIVNETQTGEWSEDAIGAASSLLLQRHGREFVPLQSSGSEGESSAAPASKEKKRDQTMPIELGFLFFGVSLAMLFVPTPGSWSDGRSQWVPELLFAIAAPIFLFSIVRLGFRPGFLVKTQVLIISLIILFGFFNAVEHLAVSQCFLEGCGYSGPLDYLRSPQMFFDRRWGPF